MAYPHKYQEVSDEDLFIAWDHETEKAEVSDEWDEVAEIEQELIRRGIHPDHPKA